MASRIRNPFKVAPRHRRAIKQPRRTSYPHGFVARRCAGKGSPDGCLGHLHPGDPVLPVWRTGVFARVGGVAS